MKINFIILFKLELTCISSIIKYKILKMKFFAYIATTSLFLFVSSQQQAESVEPTVTAFVNNVQDQLKQRGQQKIQQTKQLVENTAAEAQNQLNKMKPSLEMINENLKNVDVKQQITEGFEKLKQKSNQLSQDVKKQYQQMGIRFRRNSQQIGTKYPPLQPFMPALSAEASENIVTSQPFQRIPQNPFQNPQKIISQPSQNSVGIGSWSQNEAQKVNQSQNINIRREQQIRQNP